MYFSIALSHTPSIALADGEKVYKYPNTSTTQAENVPCMYLRLELIANVMNKGCLRHPWDTKLALLESRE